MTQEDAENLLREAGQAADESFPLFDERDRVNVYNLGEFALVNRVLAKPRDPKAGGAREILSFSLAQAFSFDDTQPLQTAPDGSKSSSRSALFATLRFYPAQSFTLQAQAQYNTLFGGLDSTSLSATLGLDRVYVGLNWFIKGHTSKFTLDYQQRPVYGAVGNDFNYLGTRGQVVLQYQIFF